MKRSEKEALFSYDSCRVLVLDLIFTRALMKVALMMTLDSDAETEALDVDLLT